MAAKGYFKEFLDVLDCGVSVIDKDRGIERANKAGPICSMIERHHYQEESREDLMALRG